MWVPGTGCDHELFGRRPSGRQVIVPDGESIDAMAEALLAAAPAGRFEVVAHSLGGFVALRAATIDPQRIARLVLISTAARSDSPQQAEARRTLIAACETDFDGVVRRLARAMVWQPPDTVSPLLPRVEAMLRRVGQATILRQLRAALWRPDLSADAAGVGVPTMVLCGREDRIIAHAASVELAGAIAGSELVVLDRCGHAPTLEHAEAARRIAAWTANRLPKSR